MKSKTKAYIDQQVNWLIERQKIEFNSVRDAVNKVEVTNAQKFESQNEWRGQFKDQTSTFLTRREFWGAVIGLIIAMAGFMIAILVKH